MTEMQKQFEEWARENLKCNLSHNGDNYDYAGAYYAWEGWQASRAAIVVKLPSFFSDRYETELCFTDVVEKSLDAAGIRYE